MLPIKLLSKGLKKYLYLLRFAITEGSLYDGSPCGLGRAAYLDRNDIMPTDDDCVIRCGVVAHLLHMVRSTGIEVGVIDIPTLLTIDK
jgi:hypothetical protein